MSRKCFRRYVTYINGPSADFRKFIVHPTPRRRRPSISPPLTFMNMVLRANLANRFDAENRPPPLNSPGPTKPLTSRLRSSLTDSARRRRARATASPHASKYVVEFARRRQEAKKPGHALRIKVTTLAAPPASPSRDVEMQDAEPPSPVPTRIVTRSVVLPRELGRPAYCAVSKAAVEAVAPDLVSDDAPPIDVVRDMLPAFAPE